MFGFDLRQAQAIEFADLGEQNLKNIPRPVRAYAMVQEDPSPATNARNSIRLTSVATLASCWLLPRLPRLQAVHPHLQLTISTTNHAVDFSRDEFDCGIRHGMGLWPGLESTLLFKEVLVLAGSPSLLRRLTGKHIARSLRLTPIIAVKTRRSDLARWWQGNGLAGPPPRARLVVENRSQALAAAIAGNGLSVIDARFIAAPGLDTPIGSFTGSRQGWQMAGGGDFLTIFGSILEAQPNGLGLLWYTRQVFRNFVLKLDWLSFNPTTNVPGGRADNSGVLIRFPPLNASDPGNDWKLASDKGYEIQIDDMGFNVDTGQNFSPLHQTGAVYGLTPSSAIASKPAGQWNTFEIEATDAAISVTLNGQLVSTYLIQANDGRRREGHIGLQCHRQRAIPERDDPVFA